MTGQKQVDPPTLESLAQSYTTLEHDATAISAYLHANCQLDNSIGLLLFWLRPMFEQGRDHGFTAFANASVALKGAAHQVTGALHDAEVAEAERGELLRALQAEVDNLTARVGQLEQGAATSSGVNGGGGSGGSGSGGGGGGGGGSFRPVSPGAAATLPTAPPAPAPPIAPPTTVAPGTVPPPAAVPGIPDAHGGSTTGVTTPVTVNLTVDERQTTITVGNGNSGAVSVGGDVNGTVVGAPGALGTGAVGTDPLTGSSSAHDSAMYDQLWKDMAKDDPLGRTAEQLRVAWESREAIEIPDSTSSSTLGYSTDAGADLPDLRILPDLVAVPGLSSSSASGLSSSSASGLSTSGLSALGSSTDRSPRGATV